MEQSSSASLCLQLEPTRRCLHENDVIAGGELKRLPDAGGQGDPTSGLDSSGSPHWLGLTSFELTVQRVLDTVTQMGSIAAISPC